MNRVFAIAVMALRNSMRSKIVAVLLCALLLALIGVPLTIKGDGTLEGHVRLLLRYTLGLATLILSFSTLWAACAAVSTEIKDRQIQMVVSKPVRASQIWLGKWLGLTLLHTLLLVACAAVTYGAIRWTTRPGTWDDAARHRLHSEILLAQRNVAPRPVDVRDEVRRRYDEVRARGEWPENVTQADGLRLIEREVRTHANAVAPGTFNRWTFAVPYRPPADRPLILRYRFAVSALDMEPIRAIWAVGPVADPWRLRVEVEDPPNAWHRVLIPAVHVADDLTLTVEFANVHDRPRTVLFDPDSGLQLMVYEGGFLPNYTRAMLLIAFHLALLCAIGLTAGTFFSTPVAALASFYMLLLLHSSRFVSQLAERDVSFGATGDAGWIEQAMALLTRVVHTGLNNVIQPVHTRNPLDLVSVGEAITWGEVGHQFILRIVVYAGLLGVLASFHLTRKEVALPQ